MSTTTADRTPSLNHLRDLPGNPMADHPGGVLYAADCGHCGQVIERNPREDWRDAGTGSEWCQQAPYVDHYRSHTPKRAA
jgi:hypothetical protein